MVNWLELVVVDMWVGSREEMGVLNSGLLLMKLHGLLVWVIGRALVNRVGVTGNRLGHELGLVRIVLGGRRVLSLTGHSGCAHALRSSTLRSRLFRFTNSDNFCLL